MKRTSVYGAVFLALVLPGFYLLRGVSGQEAGTIADVLLDYTNPGLCFDNGAVNVRLGLAYWSGSVYGADPVEGQPCVIGAPTEGLPAWLELGPNVLTNDGVELIFLEFDPPIHHLGCHVTSTTGPDESEVLHVLKTWGDDWYWPNMPTDFGYGQHQWLWCHVPRVPPGWPEPKPIRYAVVGAVRINEGHFGRAPNVIQAGQLRIRVEQ